MTAIVLQVSAAAAAYDAGCSVIDGVESAQAFTAIIEKGGRAPTELANIYVLRGEFYRSRGMLDLAFSDFAEALRLSPGLLNAYYHRGLAYRDSNQLEAALADLNRVASDGQGLGPRFARAGVLELLHENEEALEDYNHALYDLRGAVLLRTAQFARGKADIDRALSIDPTNLDAQAHAANLLDQQGEHARAVAEFDRILRTNPQHIPAHIGKGAALLGLGQFDRALAEFDRALAITPNSMQIDALVARGIALAAKGRRKEANANVERALDLGPDNAKAALGQALVLGLSKQLDRAITVLDRSIANGNEDPLMFVLRGKALAQTGALDRAIADFDQALKLRPLDAEALTARGSVWMKKKNYARALADLDQSIGSQATVAGYVVRGALHETQGRCSLAMADYRQARELKPSSTLDAAAQAMAKGRLEQYARRKSCSPAGERGLAGGGFWDGTLNLVSRTESSRHWALPLKRHAEVQRRQGTDGIWG
jgi:tetratricopeptide (TPR) repeat protein